MKTITYQGVKGSFSYLTAVKEFGLNHVFVDSHTFQEAFERVENGQADYAVMAIENSLIGSIYENYDLLNHFDMQIVGEHFTRIEHCLLALKTPQDKTQQLRSIQKVLSHPKALAQCTRFFQQHPWMEAVVHMDTAAAAAEISERGDPAYAAIASAQAGELYGLNIVSQGIEDDPKNYTRFVLITKEAGESPSADKCSLLIQLKNRPGILVEVLKLFASQGLNLTKIESRPLKGSPFEYLFYIDIEYAGKTKEDLENILRVLRTKVELLKILGFYKRGLLWRC